MKEFIDKLIERLEENTIQHKESITLFNECGVKFIAAGKVKEIVNQLAEEYKVSEMPTGWFPCSERMPEEYEFVLCYGKNREGESKYEVSTYAHEIHCWMCSRIADVLAWMPLPAPYTEGE